MEKKRFGLFFAKSFFLFFFPVWQAKHLKVQQYTIFYMQYIAVFGSQHGDQHGSRHWLSPRGPQLLFCSSACVMPVCNISILYEATIYTNVTDGITHSRYKKDMDPCSRIGLKPAPNSQLPDSDLRIPSEGTGVRGSHYFLTNPNLSLKRTAP